MPVSMDRTLKKVIIGIAAPCAITFGLVLTWPAMVLAQHQGLTTYTGSASCSTTQCHPGKAEEVHGSAHYQLKGPTPAVPNLKGQIAGKMGQLNDFCTYPDINWLFEMTNTAGTTVVAGCGGCHVGMGAIPSPTPTPAQLANIDCLMCHSEVYKRKAVIDPPGTAPKFVPDQTVILQALAAIQKTPSTATCLTRCHTGAGGGAKQGDMYPILNPPPTQDVHLAAVAAGGAGLSCLNCHTAQNHRIAGRGSDIRETDLAVKVDCQNCHTAAPHDNQEINKHTTRVSCTVCHIPTFSRTRTTEVYRDFSKTEIDPAVNRWEPVRTMATNITPTYKWFDGQSYFYEFGSAEFGQRINFRPGGNFLMSNPLGDILDSNAKIHAFKYHKAKMAYDLDMRRLIPTKSKVLWETGNVDQTFRQGAAEVGWTISGFSFIQGNRFLSLHHEVPANPQQSALQCTDCHVSTGRMNFKELGYFVKITYNNEPLCASCHDRKTADFYKVHNKHVDGEGYSCTTCHMFKPQPILGKPPVITGPVDLLMLN